VAEEISWRGFTITVGDLERTYFEAAAEGRLVVQVCDDCGVARYPPTDRCAACGSRAWEWKEASGRGKVTSCVVIEHGVRDDQLRAPYAAALVELDDFVNGTGASRQPVRILANVYSGEGEQLLSDVVPDGTHVEVMFQPFDRPGMAVPQFRLTNSVR
jgi:uncharacterized protein